MDYICIIIYSYMQQNKACQYDAYMLHAPKTCVHECMRTCPPRTDLANDLAKPVDSLHERMHATRNIYKLLIPIKIGTRNTNLKILCPS